MGVLSEPVFKRLLQMPAQAAHPRGQVLLKQFRHNGEPGGDSDRVAEIGVPVLEKTRTAGDGVIDAGRAEHRPDRLVARAETLGDTQDVRATPSASQAKRCPVRPMPHMTSSRISRTP